MNEILPQFLFYANVLWQRRWVALAVGWVACVAGWAYVAAIPDVYQSRGRIYFDTSTILSPLLQGLTVNTNIRSEIDVMQRTLLSRPNLIRVAQMTDLDVTATSEQELDRLYTLIRANARVGTSGNNLFTISYDGADPKVARNVVQSFITLFVESNLGKNRQDMNAATDFLDRQIAEYETKLEEAEQRSAEFKRVNMALLPGQNGYTARLEKARKLLAELEADMSEAQTQHDVIKAELATIPAAVDARKSKSVGPPLSAENRIITVEAQLEQLLSVYTERHPDVVALTRRLGTLREELAGKIAAIDIAVAENVDGAGSAESVFRTPNPLYDLLRARAVNLTANVEVLKKQIATQRDVVADLESKAEAVPFVQAEFARLDRDYGVIRSNYQNLLGRRESARISMDRNVQADEVQFRVVDPPEIPVFPVGPDRSTMFMTGTVVGLGSGIGVALLLAFLNMSYATAGHLTKDFKYPVVGSIMRISELNRRQLRPVDFGAFASLLLALPLALVIILQIESSVGFGRLMQSNLLDGDFALLIQTLSDIAEPWISRLPGL